MFTALSVAQELKKNNIKFKGFMDHEDDQVDGEVMLTEKTHTQVGETYLYLVTERGSEIFEYLHETTSLQNMIYFIKSSLANGKI
jgi:hypothetical protein